MGKPKYMIEIEKMKEKLEGKSGIIEVYHNKDMNSHLKIKGCECPIHLKFIGSMIKHKDNCSVFGIRHIFTDKTIEPLDDIGQTHGATILMRGDGSSFVGNFPKFN